MADTLIFVVNEVLRATGQQADKTAFSETDSTAFIRDMVNKGLRKVYNMGSSVIDSDDSVSLAVSTRTVSPPSGVDPHAIYDWSVRINDTNGDIPLDVVTREFIITNFPEFEAFEAARPEYMYLDGGNLAFYPLVESTGSTLTIQFTYPTQFVKLTSTSDTFPFEDQSDEMEYIKQYAQLKYEVFKGLGQPEVTYQEVEDLEAALTAKYARTKKIGFTGSRIIGGKTYRTNSAYNRFN